MSGSPDLMICPTAPASPSCWVAVVVVTLAFLCVEQRFYSSQKDEYGTTQEDLQENAKGGKISSQVGYSLLALLGGFFISRRFGPRFSFRGLLPLATLLFFGWCLASVCWSIDPGRGFRKGIILLFCFVAAVGLARQLQPRDLCPIVLASTSTYALLGLGAELILGTFKPWGSDYRFAGMMHPNGQGVNCALLCMSATLLLGHVRRAWWPLLLALLACGLPLLLLTKSRTSLFGALIALLVVPFLKPTRGLIVALVVAVWSVGVVLLAALLLGLGVEDRLTDVILLGRAEHIGTFSGRTELWEELLTYVQARPLIGYGYSSFWTLQHIEDVSSSQFWGISEAHSVYLEAVLNVGLVGAGLLGVMVVCSFFQAVWSYRRDADPGIALTLMLLVFGMISGLTEADFLMTGNATFMTGCGVGYLAFFSEVSRA